MKPLNVIITGATGMVGEGVLLECLAHPDIRQVLVVGRKPTGRNHPKLKEALVPDFMELDQVEGQVTGYDACFFCAGISSAGMKEAEYTRITYDTTLQFASTLARLNPDLVFGYVSGQMTDSTEQGKIMWARVKGRTENALLQLPFKRVYNFRPGLMQPAPGQQNVKPLYKFMGALYPVFRAIFPNSVCTLREVGLAMINSVRKGYENQILEVKDIKALVKA